MVSCWFATDSCGGLSAGQHAGVRGRSALQHPDAKNLCHISLSPNSCVRQTKSIFCRWSVHSSVVAKFMGGFASLATALALSHASADGPYFTRRFVGTEATPARHGDVDCANRPEPRPKRRHSRRHDLDRPGPQNGHAEPAARRGRGGLLRLPERCVGGAGCKAVSECRIVNVRPLHGGIDAWTAAGFAVNFPHRPAAPDQPSVK